MDTLYDLYKAEPFMVEKEKVNNLTGVNSCNGKLMYSMSFPYMLQRSVSINRGVNEEFLVVLFNTGEVIIEGQNLGELVDAINARTLNYVRAMDKKEIEGAKATKTPIITSIISKGSDAESKDLSI